MIGLLFLGTVVVWLSVCVWMAQKLGNVVTKPPWRIPVSLIGFILLLSLPFVDEVIGKRQFETLCRTNGVESADVSKARGKKVKVEFGERMLLEGMILPIREANVLFGDAESGEVLIRHKNYYADGGWLMRNTWLSMGSSHPILFGGFCNRRIEQEIFKTNSITFLYK